MFDSGGAGVAGLLARAQTLIGQAVAAISSQLPGPAAAEALSAAVEVESQATLAVTLLSERVDRSGEFAADGSVSMAAWLREQSHGSHGYASSRVLAGRALVDDLPATLSAWKSGKMTFEHVMVIRKAVDGLDPAGIARLERSLAAAAVTCSPKDLRGIANALLEEYFPDRQERRRDDKEQRQRLHLPDTLDGGRLDADLDAESTAILKAAIDKYLPPQAGVKASYQRAVALIEMAAKPSTSAPTIRVRRTNHIWLSPSATRSCAASLASATCPTAPPCRHRRCGGWPATRRSSPPSSGPMGCLWISDGRRERFRRRSAPH